MLLASSPIGVFDSGVGGLSVLRALRAALPHESFVYLADSANAPYGERGDAFVAARTHAIVDALRARYQIKALVVACNTATAAAIHEVRSRHPDLPLVGLEPALKPALTATRTGRVGVIGTRGTLTSAKFARLLASLGNGVEFVVQPCDGLAHAIERSAALPQPSPTGGTTPPAGQTDAEALCARYLEAMGRFGTAPGEIDTLVLGCTHYVFVRDTLQRLAGPGVQLIETGEPVARQTLRLLEAAHLRAPAATAGHTHLLTTGPLPLLQAAAQHWLGLDAAHCEATAVP